MSKAFVKIKVELPLNIHTQEPEEAAIQMMDDLIKQCIARGLLVIEFSYGLKNKKGI